MPGDAHPSEAGHSRVRADEARALLDAVRVEGNAARYAKAVRLARRALRLLGDSTDEPELRALLLINLGSFVAILGDVDQALQLLDEATRADPRQSPAAFSAQGLIYERSRQYPAALESFDRALAFQPPPDHRIMCITFIRRGLVHTGAGRLAAAIADLQAAEQLSQLADLGILAYMARHNLGWVRFLQGDLPGALAAMEAAKQFAADTPEGEPALDRARVLMAAGLLGESREFAGRAVADFTAERTPAALAEGLMVLSDLNVMAGDPAAAVQNARAAATATRRGGLENLSMISRVTLQRARAALRPTRPASVRTARADAAAARKLAESLVQAALPEDAAAAYLFEAGARTDAGQIAEARAAIEDSSRWSRHPALADRLHRHLIVGRIAFAERDQRRGLTELRRGLDDLADFQARFGSQDMQAGAAVHGEQLAKLGLRTAIGTGSPAMILQWLERARAVSTRLPVVNPPADPELADTLGALRFATGQARQAVLAGRRDPVLDRRVTDLRQQVRARSWIVAGSGTVQRPLTLAAVQRLLATDPSDPTVVAYITGQSAVRALVITARQADYRSLGGWQDDAPRHRRRGADLDMLAAPRVPVPIRTVARRSVDRELEWLSAELVDPIADRLRAGPVIIAVTGELATVPWTLLPGLRGRAVSVSSSVTAALAAGGRPARAHLRGVLAVSGPDVENGAKEAAAVAALHPGAGLLTDESATGEAVLAQMPAGGLLHVAAHGHHEADSPLFSSVLLADGPLYGYDIAPSPQLPDQVVLSSCDVGRSDVRPGGEPLGLAAALLRSGVSTVLAGVSRISDRVAAEVMVAYHQALLAGQGPAAALAVAVEAMDGELAPFNCFGAGR